MFHPVRPFAPFNCQSSPHTPLLVALLPLFSGRRLPQQQKHSILFVDDKVEMDSKRQRKKSFYSVLGVSENASQSEIRTAYRKLAMRWHPDKCSREQAKKVFQEVQEAYSVLSDEGRRMMYDLGLYDSAFEDDCNSGLEDNYDFGSFLTELSGMMAQVKEEDEKLCTLEDLQSLFVSMFGADLAAFRFNMPGGTTAEANKKYREQDEMTNSRKKRRDQIRDEGYFVYCRSSISSENSWLDGSCKNAKQPRMAKTNGRQAGDKRCVFGMNPWR